jgi:chromosome condensin MukBEF ATPase and DNA-binding subunit MukB
VGVQLKVDNIMTELKEVEMERDHLLHCRVHKMEADIERLTQIATEESAKSTELASKVAKIETSKFIDSCAWYGRLISVQLCTTCKSMSTTSY